MQLHLKHLLVSVASTRTFSASSWRTASAVVLEPTYQLPIQNRLRFFCFKNGEERSGV